MRYFLVRHGESEGNVNKALYDEKSDFEIDLTMKGKAQAVTAATKILEVVDKCNTYNLYGEQYSFKQTLYADMFFSPYKRAKETANIIKSILDYHKEDININLYRENVLLHERRWGKLRKHAEQFKRKSEEREKLFTFFHRPEDGESFYDAYQRAVLFDLWLNTHNTYENRIIVAHGEFNKVYIMHLLGWSIDEFENYQSIKNGEVIVIKDGRLSPLTPLRLKN
jgi:broad specificity phosphatase PhoE